MSDDVSPGAPALAISIFAVAKKLGRSETNHTADFLLGWDAEKVLERWQEELRAFGIDPGVVVHYLPVTRPTRVMGIVSQKAGWWERERVDEYSELIPRFMASAEYNDFFPTVPEAVRRTYNRGVAPTISAYLLAVNAQNDPRLTGANLIGASLSARLHSAGRGCMGYPSTWPSPSVAEQVEKWIWEVQFMDYPSLSRNTLPVHFEGHGTITTMAQFVSMLAQEHARLLHAYAPVYLQFGDAEARAADLEDEAEERDERQAEYLRRIRR